MNKRERLEHTLAGDATDRIPAALWRHFPGDDQRASDFAAAVVTFQNMYDWDFVNVTPANTFAVVDYGVQDAWIGAIDGTRSLSKAAIERSLDWTALRPLDPTRGALGRQLDALRSICDALGDEVPIVQTILSPLSQGALIAGHDRLIAHMRTQPDRLRTGLNALTETTLRFIDALKRLPIAGIFYNVSYADHALISEAEYIQSGLPDDQRILSTLTAKWWLNMVHLTGLSPMLNTIDGLSAHVLNWRDQESEYGLAMGKTLFGGAVCGGLTRDSHLHNGTPSTIRQAAREAIAAANGRRLILGAGGAALITTPQSNLRAVRQAVESL
ncbi:MAG: uroporphyrinogen decarboxylase family protein [Chloroflexota bacterium]|nr:uroporphyrinogen decarboxylase family protein [Chloroflexota bacterium]